MLKCVLLIMFTGLFCNAASGSDRMIAVQAFDHANDTDHTLVSAHDLEAFRRFWGARKRIDRPYVQVEWDAGLRIDFHTSSQIWLYDSRRGIVSVLTKTFAPQYRIDDIAAFNELLRIGPGRP